MTQAIFQSDPPTSAKPTALDRKLRALWRRQRGFAHARGLAATLLTITALIVVGLLIDRLLVLPPVARVLMLIGIVVAVVSVAYLKWWVHLRPYDARRAALQVERHHKQLGSALIAYVQFDHMTEGSAQLAAAAREQAVRQAQPLSFSQMVRFADLQALTLAALVAMLTVVGIGVRWPQTLATFGHRMINPLSDRLYPTRTQVTLTTAPQRLARGTSVLLAADITGIVPAEGSLEVRYDDVSGWEALPLTVTGDDRLEHRFASVDRGFDYRFRAGDGRSLIGHVEVVMPPNIERVAVTLDYPRYTGLEEQTVDSLNVRAPWGTAMTLRIALDKPIEAGQIIVVDDKTDKADAPDPAESIIDLNTSEQGTVATLELPVRTMEYRLRWTRRVEGQTYHFEDPVHYRMVAMPDTAPHVRVLEPVEIRQVGTLSKRVPLRFRANDDHGLTEAWVVYRLENRQEEQRVPIGKLEGRHVAEHDFTWSLRDTVKGLAVGDKLEYTVEVADNRDGEGGRQRGRATTWRTIEVLSVEAFLQRLAERQLDSFEQLQQVGEDTIESRDSVRRLEHEAPSSDQENESSP